MEKQERLYQIISTTILAFVLIGGTGVFFWQAGFFSKENQKQPKVVEVPFSAVDCPKDSGSYQKVKAIKNLVLLSDKQSYGIKGDGFKSYDVSIERTGLNSEIACGYLFYKVSEDKKPIDQRYEDIYMIPRDSVLFGGHILPSDSNTISNNNINGETEILMPLNDISYDGTDRKNIKRANWVALLNTSSSISFTIALNTLNEAGSIDSVEIAYKCWNPITGQETDDCNLAVVK